jgi:hypothetical protein
MANYCSHVTEIVRAVSGTALSESNGPRPPEAFNRKVRKGLAETAKKNASPFR